MSIQCLTAIAVRKLHQASLYCLTCFFRSCFFFQSGEKRNRLHFLFIPFSKKNRKQAQKKHRKQRKSRSRSRGKRRRKQKKKAEEKAKAKAKAMTKHKKRINKAKQTQQKQQADTIVRQTGREEKAKPRKSELNNTSHTSYYILQITVSHSAGPSSWTRTTVKH